MRKFTVEENRPSGLLSKITEMIAAKGEIHAKSQPNSTYEVEFG